MTKYQTWEKLFKKYIQEGITAEEHKELQELETFLRNESAINPNWKEA
jgi:hypothetical protein